LSTESLMRPSSRPWSSMMSRGSAKNSEVMGDDFSWIR
jgi:hypothetical protein